MKKLTVLVLVVVFAMAMVSCDFFNIGGLPGRNEFTEVDAEEVIAKFYDGTFKDKVFSGDSNNFRYKVEIKNADEQLLIDMYINLSINGLIEKMSSVIYGNLPEDLKISSKYNAKQEDEDVETTIYFSEGKGYIDVKKYEALGDEEDNDDEEAIVPGKYKDFRNILFILIAFDFEPFDVMNLVNRSQADNAESSAVLIESIKKAEKVGKTYYEIYLNDDGLEFISNSNYFDDIEFELEDLDIRIIYTLQGNEVIGFDVFIENKENNDFSFTLSAQKVATEIKFPDFSEFTTSFPQIGY